MCAGANPVVLDLGAGTGLLGHTALRHGARRVYGVEGTGFVDWTAAVAAANNREDHYVALAGKSTELTLPELVDLVVCDQFGGFLLEGRPFPVLADAAERHLLPGGRLLPFAVDFCVAPMSSDAVAGAMAFWDESRFGLDVSAMRELDAATPRWSRTRADELLGDAVRLGRIDTSVPARAVDWTVTVTLEREGMLNAVAGWFVAHLAQEVSFGTAPGDPARIDRDNIVLAVNPPYYGAAGDEVEVRVRALFDAQVMTWDVTPAGEASRRHSTWASFTAARVGG